MYDTINGWMPHLTRVHAAPEVPLNAAWQSGLTSFEVGYTLQSSPLPFPRGLRQDGHPETQRWFTLSQHACCIELWDPRYVSN